MSLINEFSDAFTRASQTFSISELLSMLAGLSFVTYMLIIFGGRGR